MTREEEIRKAARAYAMTKAKENNTWFVDDKDIEEAFFEGAKFAYTYSEKVTTNKKRSGNDSDN